MKELLIRVIGVPAPQGSHRAYVPTDANGQPIRKGKMIIANVVENNKKVKPWRAAVAAEAGEKFRSAILRVPIELSIVFLFPRPKNHYHQRKSGNVLRDDAPIVVPVKPDLDKLVRAIKDALTSVVWADDSLVVRHGRMIKRYTEGHPGAWIRIRCVEPTTGEVCDFPESEVIPDDIPF